MSIRRYFLVCILMSGVLCALSATQPFDWRNQAFLMGSLFQRYRVAVVRPVTRVPPTTAVLGKYAKRYRQFIRNAIHKPVNFAGRYILVFWGCGTNCITGVIYDPASGRLAPIPTCEWGLVYTADSRLLVENPPGKDGRVEETRPAWAFPVYWIWTRGRFIKVKDR